MWLGAQGLFNHHNSSCLRIIILTPLGTSQTYHRHTLDGLVWAVAAVNTTVAWDHNKLCADFLSLSALMAFSQIANWQGLFGKKMFSV